MSDIPPGESELSDAHLVSATLDGDRDAFGILVERYQDRLFNTLVRVLGSRHDASDVLQEAFVKAYTRLDSYRGDASFYTWLYRVAMNLALSHHRKQKRRGVAMSVEDVKDRAGIEPTDRQPGPEATMIQCERAQVVQAALLKLGNEHRQILVLREMEDCSYESIAEILELPVGTVRSRLFRARLQLKEHLQGMFVERVENRE